MEKINSVCKMILALTDEDFAEMDEIIDEQKNYCNPLRMATSAWQNQLGDHNANVVEKLKELKAEIEKGANIVPPASYKET